MLNEVMGSINNHFAIDKRTGELYGYEDGEFTLVDGKIEVYNKYVAGQYIAITGSTLNNGVYRVEGFEGGVISLIQNIANFPAWVKPASDPKAYNTGDRVRHNNLRWVSLQDLNMVEPGSPSSTGVWWSLVPGVEIQSPFTDEEWFGTIYRLVVPHPFLMLVERILEFTKTNAGQASNIVNASFGIQSTTFGVDSNGVRAGWATVYRDEINAMKIRRMRPDIMI